MTNPRPNGRGRPPTLQNPHRTIRDAAAALFAAKGYERTSLQDIASAIGVTKAGLYHYFSTKQDLYDSITLEVLQSMLAGAVDAAGKAEGTSDRLRAFMVAHARYFERNNNMYRAIFLGRHGIGEGYTFEQLQARRKYTDFLTGILREGQESGELDCSDPAAMARGILGMLNWMARWYRPSGPRTVPEIADSFASTILKGLVCAQPKPRSSTSSECSPSRGGGDAGHRSPSKRHGGEK